MTLPASAAAPRHGRGGQPPRVRGDDRTHRL